MKSWILWYIGLAVILTITLCKEIPLQHSLSQMDWSIMWAYAAGTIFGAIGEIFQNN